MDNVNRSQTAPLAGKGRRGSPSTGLTRRTLAGLAAVLAAPTPGQADSAPPLVFAAASLQDVLPGAAAAVGFRPRFSFGGSSALARQIEQGAPADLFLSADLDWMDYLDQRGLIVRASRRNLLSNRLVLVSGAGSLIRLRMGRSMPLAAALANGRLAIADPAGVPAGRYARAALTSLDVWNSIAGRLAPADSVRGALAFVARGECPLGVVYATDAMAERRVRIVGVFPESSHPPIVYPGALVAGARNPGNAAALLGALQSPRAAAAFRQAGFGVLARPR